MGFDIFVKFDLEKEIAELLYQEDYDEWSLKHELSRTFFQIIFNEEHLEDIPTMMDLGEVVNVDVEPIRQMKGYMTESGIEEYLEMMSDLDEQSPEETIANIKEENKKYEGNIDTVIDSLESLISKLSEIKQLDEVLASRGFSTKGNAYFQDFNKPPHESYVYNNLGQDLNNLLRHARYGKRHQARTITFDFG